GFGWHPTVLATTVPLRMIVETAAPVAAATATGVTYQALAPALADMTAMLPSVLIALWLLGASALVITWVVRWRRVAALVRSAEPIDQGAVFDMLRRHEHAAGVRRAIALKASDAALEPGIFGMRRPTLMWPRSIEHHLTSV